MFRKRRRRARKSFSQRLFRSVTAVVILTAFVMAISFFVREISNMDAEKAIKLSRPLLVKLGISPEAAGQVAGTFADRLFRTNIAPSQPYVNKDDSSGDLLEDSAVSDKREETGAEIKEVLFEVAIMGDSHNNNDNLSKAMLLAKDEGVNSVFFLGDYSDWGAVSELEDARSVMDKSGVKYYSLPGDHDLAESVGTNNYEKVFGKTYQSVTIGETKFLMLNNSANFTPLDDAQISWFKKELKDADVVLLSQPVYYPNISIATPVMGLVEGEVVEEVRNQAEEILSLIRESEVALVVSADHHRFSRSLDEKDSDLEHVVVGAVYDYRKIQKRPSITVLSVNDDRSYDIEELFID